MYLQKLSINNLVHNVSFFQHSGVSIVFVFLPIISGTIAFYYVDVMYFVVAIIVGAFLISLKIKREKMG